MLDEINKTRDPETKGVRPFAYSKNILMILLLAKVLSPISFYKEEIKQEKQFLRYILIIKSMNFLSN